MQALAEGRLDAAVPATERSDEVGTMACSVRLFRDALAEAERLRQAEAIAGTVREQGCATREIVSFVDQASTRTGDITATIAGVSQAARETGHATTQVFSTFSELAGQSGAFAWAGAGFSGDGAGGVRVVGPEFKSGWGLAVRGVA